MSTESPSRGESGCSWPRSVSSSRCWRCEDLPWPSATISGRSTIFQCEAGTSTILSVANIVAPSAAPSTPSSSTPALSGVLLTIPQSDFPTPTYPSTSAAILSLVTPQAAVISDLQAVSTIATFDTHEDAYDLATPAKPCPQPDKASLPPPDVATEPVPLFCDVGPLSQGTVRLITATDSPERPADPSP